MTSDLRETARRALFWASLKDAVEVQEMYAREEAELAMIRNGSERQRVRGEDEADMGTVTLSPGRRRARVDDARALLEWVKRNRPEHILSTVNPAYLRVLLKQAEESDGELLIDRETGAVIPGVTVEESSPILSIRKTPRARERAGAILEQVSGGLTALPDKENDSGL